MFDVYLKSEGGSSFSETFFRFIFSFNSNKYNNLWYAAYPEAAIWLSNFISIKEKKKKKAPVNKNVDANHIYSLVCDKSFTPYIRVLLKTSLILHICLKIKCSTCVFYSCSTNVLQQSAGIQRSKRLTQTLQGGVSKLVSAKDVQDWALKVCLSFKNSF